VNGVRGAATIELSGIVIPPLLICKLTFVLVPGGVPITKGPEIDVTIALVTVVGAATKLAVLPSLNTTPPVVVPLAVKIEFTRIFGAFDDVRLVIVPVVAEIVPMGLSSE
jgi:hypothetical protein